MRSHLLFPAFLLTLAGCTGGGESAAAVKYTLSLVPVVPDYASGSPFADVSDLELEIVPAVGERSRVGLPITDSGGTTLAENLPALDDAVLEIYAYTPQGLQSWGRTTSITMGDGDELTQTMLVSMIDRVGWLGPSTEAGYNGALIPVGGGVFQALGGIGNNDRGNLGAKLDTIRQLSVAIPDDPPAFATVGALPAWSEGEDGGTGDSHTERAGFSLNQLTTGAHAGQWLLAGGSLRGDCASSTEVTDSAYFYDPASLTFTEIPGGMAYGREEALSVVDARGNVLYQGGGVYDSRGGCYIYTGIERFDAASESFEELDGAGSLGQVGGIAATTGTDGAIFCGGADFQGAGWLPMSACYSVSLDGAVGDVDELPLPLAGSAAVTLADGTVLVTGGVTSSEVITSASALTDAWIYNPTAAVGSRWRTVSVPMSLPRAGHRMTLLGDGRVLIVGGGASWTTFAPVDDAYACAELYDPADESFEPLSEGCTVDDDAGDLQYRTDLPLLASDPDYGVLIAGGATSALNGQNGVALFLPTPAADED